MKIVNLKILMYTIMLLVGLTATYTSSDHDKLWYTPVPVEVKNVVKKAAQDVDQIKCLATNIFHEAQGEPILGQAAVAIVTMNRVKHSSFPRTPCGVVYQAFNVKKIDPDTGEESSVKVCQFSWVCDTNKAMVNTRSAAYKQAEQIARDVMTTTKYNEVLPRTALFFHSAMINPKWAYREITQIGNHVFYEK